MFSPHKALKKGTFRRQLEDPVTFAAEKRSSQIVEEAKQAAKSEGERILAEARAEVGQEVLRAKEALRGQVAELAVVGAEKILRREIDAAKHADLLASIKAEL